jgi:catalase (peroxidase I)
MQSIIVINQSRWVTGTFPRNPLKGPGYNWGNTGKHIRHKIRNVITVALLAATSSVALTTAAVAEIAEAKVEYWPKKVSLVALRHNEARANPYGEHFRYAARAVAEIYASDDAKQRFVTGFVAT